MYVGDGVMKGPITRFFSRRRHDRSAPDYRPRRARSPLRTPLTVEQLERRIMLSIAPVVTQTGNISLSVDGLGTGASSGTIRVQKPAGATVRAAYLAAASTGFSGYRIQNGDIALNGTPVTWDTTIANSISAFNTWSNVTSLVKATIDAAPSGLMTIPVAEGSRSSVIDGEVLAVIFDDPNQTTA